ncbi:hypothetical protein EUX98_g7519 [Antrodiella citrinella]|uniref:Uncharacterized protein n=1 Tax=Antrodiella citrinella TaxID=2447956 RepID=A0A4S4MLM4_9APHY|nr:hypothetical protein EUX98_g7519 [Antrodiella citrinella]
MFHLISPSERTVEKGKKLSFPPPGNGVEAVEIDIPAMVINRNGECLLFVLNCSGKNPSKGHEYEPLVAAAAMAVYRHNNAARQNYGLGIIGQKVMYCIVMIGSAPVFYRVAIEFYVVEHMERPGNSLILKKHVPAVSDQGRHMLFQ